MKQFPNPLNLSIREVIFRIVAIHHNFRKFWSEAHGWAPKASADLLKDSRLDWLCSISESLLVWFEEHQNLDTTARLILGWVNLGSLVEGSMKFFLCIWLESYYSSPNIITKGKNKKVVSPDRATFENLRVFFKNEIWVEKVNDHWEGWLLELQLRRNAIHAFQDRTLGNIQEFEEFVRKYLLFLRELNSSIPYPENMQGINWERI